MHRWIHFFDYSQGTVKNEGADYARCDHHEPVNLSGLNAVVTAEGHPITNLSAALPITPIQLMLSLSSC